MSVVYRTIPTSNHNVAPPQEDFNVLYIVLFLHQTTTKVVCVIFPLSCISYYSYIKPQLAYVKPPDATSCISYYSYIKPQQ